MGLNSAYVESDPAVIDEELLATIEKTSAEFWSGVPVVPIMSAGATDGLFLRNAGIPTYGHSGLASDIDDVRAHGKDERVAVKSFFDGGEYLHRLVRRSVRLGHDLLRLRHSTLPKEGLRLE